MAGKTDTVKKGAAVAQAKKEEPKQQAQQQQYDSRDYIETRGKHPDAAVYVARDKKSGAEVSFDQWGRKLDSVGNVVQGDRQRAGDAGARIAIKPQQQQAPEQKQYVDGGYGSKLTNMLLPGRAQQQPATVAPERSAWDNSVIGPQRGNNSNTLAPGGMDNSFLGMSYPTASNGLLGSQWAKPWDGPQQQEPMSVAPQQAQSYTPPPPEPWRTPSRNMPYPPTGNSFQTRMPPQGNGMMYDPYGGSYNGNPLSPFGR